MRITREQATDNRKRVVDAAAKLFRERGFDNVGIAELMHAAGLTHGGFYNHFSSKDTLEAAACAAVFEGAIARIEAIAAIGEAESRDNALRDYRRRYVSPQARDASGATCPMVAFASDVSRQGEDVQTAYAEGLRRYVDAFARASFGPERAEHQRAEALRSVALLVGALTLARSVARKDPELSEAILNAARETPAGA